MTQDEFDQVMRAVEAAKDQLVETLGGLLWLVSALLATRCQPMPRAHDAINLEIQRINEKLEGLGLEELSMISPEGGRGRKVQREIPDVGGEVKTTTETISQADADKLDYT